MVIVVSLSYIPLSHAVMSHAVEGQDSNLINNSSNTEEIEYNCDLSINQSLFCDKQSVKNLPWKV